MLLRRLAPLLLTPTLAVAAWPNGPTEDPRDLYPSDPGYIQFNDKGEVTGGQWNLWSFVPENWAKNKDFRQAEVAMGTGIHADRAWQQTIGDRRVVIAVLDSGINWDNGDVRNKHFLNKAELGNCKPTPKDGADAWDVDGSGSFNIADYLAVDPAWGTAKDAEGNKNGNLDPEDLILTCSDGVDDDGNGFTDDISGWDAFDNDNNPKDDTRFGHGTGEARDSGSEGNDGKGDIGVCPECTILMVRVGDSFVVDVNDFATGTIFAVDSGAHVVQEALGSLNNNPYAVAAIEYAYRNDVAMVASAADELSFHHNMPGTNNHTLYVHAIVYDGTSAGKSTTFLNFNNCTNFGGQLILSTPGSGCSSEATGITAGHVGLIHSAAIGRKVPLDPPLSAEEIRGILIQSADDIHVPESATDKSKFPSRVGWDWHFGYGRNNARTSVDLVLDDQIPPEADIEAPLWFEPIDVLKRNVVAITGRVGGRIDGLAPRYDNYTWTLEYALGVDPVDGWETITTGNTAVGGPASAKLADWDVKEVSKRIDYTKALEDPHQWSITLRLRVESTYNGETLDNEFRKTVHLIVDDTLLPGFPKNMGASIEGSGKIVDLDGDGGEEFIFVSTDGAVHALKADGSDAPGFPAWLPKRPEMNVAGPNIAGICAFRQDKSGCIPAGGVDPETNREWSMMGPAVGALTGDIADGLFVVVTTWDGGAFVFDQKGELQPGWPQRVRSEFTGVTNPDRIIDEGFFGAPTLYDLDGDTDLEIIAAGMDGYLYVWHHDGSPMAGWPLLIHDPLEEGQSRMIITPAVGDVDADGQPDIVVCTNEVYGKNEGRGYLLKWTGAPDTSDTTAALKDGWPVTLTGLIVETLPVVGTGCPTNPALANLDDEPGLEIHLDAIAFAPQMWDADGSPFERDGAVLQVNQFDFGLKSNSQDTPAYTLMNHGIFFEFDGQPGLEFAKGTAGFDFALVFAEGGKRAVFDHQLSIWGMDDGNYLNAWPRVMDDWQFFVSPVVADIDGDGAVEVINTSAGYLVRAFNLDGSEVPGFPKNTGGWITAAGTFGDIDDDGNFDLATTTRNGWAFAWKLNGPRSGRIEWQTFGHDLHNTNNYEEPVALYNDYEAPTDGTDATDGVDATDAVDGVDATDAVDGTDTTDATDGADATDGTDAADGTDGATDATDAQDGATDDVGATPPAASDDGCTAAPSTTRGPAAGLVLMLLAIGAILRRRATR